MGAAARNLLADETGFSRASYLKVMLRPSWAGHL